MLSLFFGVGMFRLFYQSGRPIPQKWMRSRSAPLFGDGMIHIGKLIEAELRRQERTVSWFARNLYCERTNVYDIFKRRSIDTQMLLRISLLLHHNFFRYYLSEAESDGEAAGRQ